jgi:hypothetical protein
MLNFLHRKPKDKPESTETYCSQADCPNPAFTNCSYENALDVTCKTIWCDQHYRLIEGQAYCPQHADLLRKFNPTLKRPELKEDQAFSALLQASQETMGELVAQAPRFHSPRLLQSPDGGSYLWARKLIWGTGDYLYLEVNAKAPDELLMRTSAGIVYSGKSTNRPRANTFIDTEAAL